MASRALFAMLFATCLLACGCQHAPLVRSNFEPLDPRPPSVTVAESRYWTLPQADSQFVAAKFARQSAKMAGDEASPPLVLPASYQTESAPDDTAAANLNSNSLFTGRDASVPSRDVTFGAENTPAPGMLSDAEMQDEQPWSFRQHLHEKFSTLWPQVVQDEKNYYSWQNIEFLVVGFGIGGALANTQADQHMRNWYQREIRSTTTMEFADVFKGLGNGAYTMPAMAFGWLGGEMLGDTPCGNTLLEWGQRGVAAAAIGVPPMVIMQRITGGSRPQEGNEPSDWKPFQDDNGVSGHAFVGALPFMTAAKMTDDIGWKIVFYGCSTFAGLSRIDDDAHYPSQVLLGWWMAYAAVSAVDETHRTMHTWQVTPMPVTDGVGMAITYQY